MWDIHWGARGVGGVVVVDVHSGIDQVPATEMNLQMDHRDVVGE